MYTVYGDILSGNCYKIRLLLTLLGIEHRWQHIDIMKGESRTEAFLEMNPNGRVPVLVLPDGGCLAESNAILDYLADGTEYLPAARLERAQVLQWQFFEQYSHEPFIATSRYIIRYLGVPPERKKDLDARRDGGYAALGIMERHLAQAPFLVGGCYTVGDIALYAYTHVAEEGGFDLQRFPAVRAWIARMEAHPGHVTMAQCAASMQRGAM
jgi:glutathione S-transferase